MTLRNETREVRTLELVARLERWQRRVQELEDEAACERTLRTILARLLATAREQQVAEISVAFEHAARVLRADRIYAAVNADGRTQSAAWPPSIRLDRAGVAANLPAPLVAWALEQVRAGRRVEIPAALGSVPQGDWGALPVRSLAWVPIVRDGRSVGHLGCDSAAIEIYWSPARRAFLDALASACGAVLGPA